MDSVASQPPRVWFLHGDKGGDNNQVQTIIARLGWWVEHKALVMKAPFVLGKPRFRATIDHLDPDRSAPLSAPWPDLILTVGRRPAMAALWVRRQSGGRCRIVLVGKPNARFADFDLIVTGSETWLPPAPNYLQLRLPLLDVDRPAIAAAVAAWAPRLDALPRPLIGVLLGGATAPFRFDSAVVDRVLAETRDIRDAGGTPYVTTSRRTPDWVCKRLREELPEGAPFFAWRADARDNPYLALLGSADGLLVSGDSVSMMVEALRAGRPLQILPLPYSLSGGVDQLRRSLVRWLFNPRQQGTADRFRRLLGRMLCRVDLFGALSSARDFRAFHQMLVDQGLASRPGQPLPGPPVAPLEVEPVVVRIRALFDPRDGGR